MFKRILVPLDGSKLAEQALAHAHFFAQTFGATIYLLQVLDPSGTEPHAGVIDPLRWQILKVEADSYLQTTAARLRDHGLQVEAHILEGRTADSIVDFARTQDMDMLAICTHGQGGLSRWNWNSVVHKVISKILIPVLVIRSYIIAPSEDEPIRYQRILLPTDCSRRSECAVPVTTAVAQACGARVTLASVVRQPEIPFIPMPSTQLSQLSEQIVALAREAVEQCLADIRNRIAGEVQIRVLEHTSVLRSLHDLILEDQIDLVILCAHGYSGEPLWPYGSIANNLMEHAPCPTLVMQDVPRAQMKPTPAELAAEKLGRR